MIGLLLRTRRRRLVNFIRYHFDARTLATLAVVVGLAFFQFGRSPRDVGWSLEALRRPGFGAAWTIGVLVALPALALAFYALARLTRRATTEAQLLHVLAAPPRDVARWAMLRQLARCAFLIVPAALPAAAGATLTPAGALRALALGAGLALLSLVMLRLAPRRLESGLRRAPRRAPRIRPAGAGRGDSPIAIGGGPLRGLVTRDLVYLARWQRAPLVLMLVAALVEALVAARSGDLRQAPLEVGVLQMVAVYLLINTLEVLFERDVPHAGLLHALPIRGRQIWLARAGLSAVLLALPMLPALAVLAARGTSPLLLLGAAAVGALALPLATGLLYANVGVALFPRTRLIGLFINMALLAMTFFWFFVPVAAPLLALFVLGAWARRAPRAFDRWEAA